jgi:hypothetical protein
VLFRVLCRVRNAVLELFALGEQVVEALFDLLKDVWPRPADIFVTQLDDHLREAGYGAHGVDRIVLARR